jgi:CHAD domain-containing protein
MAAGTTTYRSTSAEPGVGEVVDALLGAGFAAEPPRSSTLEVLDTFDGRIAAAGLRLALVDGQQLVLGGEGNVPAAVSVAAPPRTAADLPPGPLQQRLARLLDVRALLPLVAISSQRTELTRRNGAGKVTTVVAVHEQPSAAGIALSTAFVVEVSELAGYARHAGEARDLIAGAGLDAVPDSLVELAAASAGVRLTGNDVPVGVPLSPELPAIDGFRAVLANLRDAMVANWDGTVADIDPEFLHDLRVAVRRSRVVLANATRVISDDRRSRARSEFAWLGEITGPVRDLDVYELEWGEYTADLDAAATTALIPLRDHLGVQRKDAHHELAVQLTSLRARVNVEAWNDWLDAPVDPTTFGDRGLEPLHRTVRRRIRRAHRRMVERGRTITPDTPAETVHELRKDAKKLRYLIECFGGLYEKSARTAFVGRLKALQDTLGAHQDAEVHANALRAIADDPSGGWTTDTLLAIGQLVERLEHVRVASRSELADRFAAFDRSETVDDLKALLASSGE